MGADLCLTWIPIKDGKEEETKKKLLEEVEKYNIPELSNNTKVKIINSLENEKSEEFEEFCEFWGDALNEEFTEDYPTEDTTNTLTMEQARGHMKRIIHQFFDCLNYRDVSSINHKGDTMYLTGGMSWGDSPTESYDTFNKFVCLPQKILIAGGIEFQ